MVRLHLSATTTTLDAPPPPPACGVVDDRAVLRRGFGEGLVPPAAISPEFHCPECVRAIRTRKV